MEIKCLQIKIFLFIVHNLIEQQFKTFLSQKQYAVKLFFEGFCLRIKPEVLRLTTRKWSKFYFPEENFCRFRLNLNFPFLGFYIGGFIYNNSV